MSLIHKVKHTLAWKKSDEYCAGRLGIPLEKYKELKQELLNRNQKVVEWREDLDEGKAEIKGVSSTEPKSAEEIIRILKIDTTQWKLSSYWNKEHKDHWLISALISRVETKMDDVLVKVISEFTPTYEPVVNVQVNTYFPTPSVGVLSVQDLHFGKEGNEQVISDFRNAISNLILRAFRSHRLEKVIYVFGGDLLNMDTFQGQTTRGTPVDNDMRAQDAYKVAFDSLYWSIHYIKGFCENLHVVYLPGNHDRLSSYHMAHALSKVFQSDENITFDADYSERKVVTYGVNFFGFEHGDVNSRNTPLVYATEYPKEWGSTVYRTCYTGHWHKKKTVEFVSEDETHGFSIKHLPSLSKSDYWHYHNKFTGSKRQAVMEIHDHDKGKVSEFVHVA
jgi:hypothetical protein